MAAVMAFVHWQQQLCLVWWRQIDAGKYFIVMK
jgi:hypothetical protein